MIIVDVGACVGLFIDYCLQEYEIETIYAFEPLKVNYNFLVSKYGSNSKIKIYNWAVSGFCGEASLYKKPDPDNLSLFDFIGNVGCSLRSDKHNIRADHYDVVKVVTLSSFFQEQQIKWVDILKIDAEGSEYDIFEDLTDHNLLDRIGSVFYEDHTRKIPRIWDKAETIIPKIRAQGYANKFYLQVSHDPVDYRSVIDSGPSLWIND